MYIQIENAHYSCTGYEPRDGTAVYYGVEGLSIPLVGVLTLYADDGFILCEQDAGGYARQVYEGNVLTLTNEPEPVPEPEPKEPEPVPLSELEKAEMLLDFETRISLLEMGVK